MYNLKFYIPPQHTHLNNKPIFINWWKIEYGSTDVEVQCKL